MTRLSKLARTRLARSTLATGILLAVLATVSPALATDAAAEADGPNYNSNARMLSTFGPFGDENRYWDLMFAVDRTFVGHCTQNNGRGEFTVESKYKGTGDSFYRRYHCAYLVVTEEQLEAAGVPEEVVLWHDYNDRGRGKDPNFANPDRDHVRYQNQCRFGGCRWSIETDAFQYGDNMAAFYYEPGPASGFYYQITVECDPAGGTDRLATRADVDRVCPESAVQRVAANRTTGPTRTLVLAFYYDRYPDE